MRPHDGAPDERLPQQARRRPLGPQGAGERERLLAVSRNFTSSHFGRERLKTGRLGQAAAEAVVRALLQAAVVPGPFEDHVAARRTIGPPAGVPSGQRNVISVQLCPNTLQNYPAKRALFCLSQIFDPRGNH